jgi:hypothetical protein
VPVTYAGGGRRWRWNTGSQQEAAPGVWSLSEQYNLKKQGTNGLDKYDLSFKSNLYYNNIGVKKIWHILQKLTVIT